MAATNTSRVYSREVLERLKEEAQEKVKWASGRKGYSKYQNEQESLVEKYDRQLKALSPIGE